MKRNSNSSDHKYLRTDWNFLTLSYILKISMTWFCSCLSRSHNQFCRTNLDGTESFVHYDGERRELPAVLWGHDGHTYKQRPQDNAYEEEHKISKIRLSKVTLIAYKQLHGSKEFLQGTVMGKPSRTPVCPSGVPAHMHAASGITMRN